MAKLNAWTSRQATALADDLSPDDDDAFLRPIAPASPQRRKPRVVGAAGDPSEQAEAFLRTRRRVPPRKGGRWRVLLCTRAGRILLGLVLLAVLAAAALVAWQVRSFLQHDPHFRIDSSSSIEASGITELSRPELLRAFGSDIGRNVFFVPLKAREAALEAQPWVRHATVMRLLPNVLRVTIVERVPVAFARIGHGIQLVDAEGVLLPMGPATLAARHYSFPVVTGLDPNGDPAARAARMRLFGSFVAALDADGAKVSSQLSEVDLGDLDDVRAVVPAQGTDILLHFGNSDFLERYHAYQAHLAEWRQQYPNLSAVDLRYDRQVVLKMADAAQADEAAETKPVSASTAKAPAPRARLKAVAARSTRTRSVSSRIPAAHSASAARKPGARTWYTRSPANRHHPDRWVPHYIPQAGRAK